MLVDDRWGYVEKRLNLQSRKTEMSATVTNIQTEYWMRWHCYLISYLAD